MRKMKRFFGLLIVGLISSFSYAQEAGVRFFDGPWNLAVERAGVEKKMIFLDCYTSWCGPCKMLMSKVFPDSLVGDYMNRNFISVKMDMEKGDGITMRERLNVTAFPTLIFFNSKGEEIDRIVGADTNPAKFIAKVKEASDSTKSVAAKRRMYEKDINYANQYLAAVASRGVASDTREALQEVFLKRDAAQRYTSKNFKPYSQNIKTIDDPVCEYIMKDSENAAKYMGEDQYRRFISQKIESKIVSLYMGDLKRGCDSAECRLFLQFASQYPAIEREEIFKFFKESYNYNCNRDVERFLAVTKKYMEILEPEQQKSLKKFAYRLSATSGKKDLFEKFEKENPIH